VLLRSNSVERALADAVIVSGERTGAETALEDVRIVRAATDAPVLIGSGATPDNVRQVFDLVDDSIVGSTFKESGNANKFVESARGSTFMTAITSFRAGASGQRAPPIAV
jgi:predicted TIM-barrel enzyme